MEKAPQEICCWFCLAIIKPSRFISRYDVAYCSQKCQKADKQVRAYWEWVMPKFRKEEDL